MKFVILSLSTVFGAISGALYDYSAPIFSMASVEVTGPVLAMSMTFFLIAASLIIGIQLVLNRIEFLLAIQRRSPNSRSDRSAPPFVVAHRRPTHDARFTLTPQHKASRMP